MLGTVELLRTESRARVFFAALAQSSLGTGAGYVALVVIAYERFESPWAIGLILLADVLPAMLLGPVFGAAADRWSRRGCAIVADILRATAFLGIAFVDSFAPTLLLAVLAGVGTGLFTPAALASLPSVVEQRRLPAATALYGAVADFGFTAGTAVAAALLLIAGPDSILLVNAATFAVSALALARLSFGAPPTPSASDGQRSLLGEAREGLVATAGMHGLRVVLVASAAALFFGGMFNVAELLLATEELGAGDVGYSVLVAVYGAGFIGGSLSGAKGGGVRLLKRRYLLGLFTMAFGFTASGASTGLPIALLAFGTAGFGNGMMLVYERLLIQASVPDAMSGRVFGVKDALTAWAFALAFLAGAAALSIVDTRLLIIAAGVAGMAAFAISAVLLRREWRLEPTVASRPGAKFTRDGVVGEHRSDIVDGRGQGLAALDHSD
jgi:Major Facilitator Superfamily